MNIKLPVKWQLKINTGFGLKGRVSGGKGIWNGKELISYLLIIYTVNEHIFVVKNWSSQEKRKNSNHYLSSINQLKSM